MIPHSLLLLLLVAVPALGDGAIHVPIYKGKVSRRLLRRAEAAQPQPTGSAIGLGDFEDTTYSCIVTVGNILVPLLLDTGSADLWVLSDGCANCTSPNSNIPPYPLSSFKPAGISTNLMYGDSQSPTFAIGPIGQDTVSIAGLALERQYFAAINETNSNITVTNTGGIFGLGFPINSIIWNEVFVAQFPKDGPLPTTPNITSISQSEASASIALKRSVDENERGFYTLRDDSRRALLGPPKVFSVLNTNLATVNDLLSTYATNGPLVPRLVMAGMLTSPTVTISLQRDFVDVGGNVGELSLGELPNGIKNTSLTWVPIRGYTVAQGGIPGPSSSPSETYPIAWEAPLDAVYFDGKLLNASTLSPNVSVTALIDTGNSLIRGPKDVVQQILKMATGSTKSTATFDCNTPHTLEFQFGGRKFPVDPRDFLWQASRNSVGKCLPNLVATDPPKLGFLYSWSLGDPFLKSVLTSFYYGNLTLPSADPPRIGFLSTVPSNASDLLQAAVASAASHGNNFPAEIQFAPDSTWAATKTGVGGVPQQPSIMPTLNSTMSTSTTATSSDPPPTISPGNDTNKNHARRNGFSIWFISSSIGLAIVFM